MEIRDPESRRISVILEPPRPLKLIQQKIKNKANSTEETHIMQPTMSEGMEIF